MKNDHETQDIRMQNIHTLSLLSEVVKGSFGPRGMSKILLDENKVGPEAMVITNDGGKIIEKVVDALPRQHVMIRIMYDAVKTQRKEVGDGSKMVVILTSGLLRNAAHLIDIGIGPSVVMNGYRAAFMKTLQVMETLAIKAPLDRDILTKVALTALESRDSSLGSDGKFLCGLVVDAVTHVISDSKPMDREDVRVEVFSHGLREDSRLLDGVMVEPVYELEKLHPLLPRSVRNGRVTILYSPIEVEKTRIRHQVTISSPKDLQSLHSEQVSLIKGFVDKVKSCGVNVILCGRRVDLLPQYYLAREGIMLVRNISMSDLTSVAKATGGKIVNNWRDLEESDLGEASVVEWRRFVEGGKWRLFVEGCKGPKAVTILIFGSSIHVRDGLKDAVNNGAAVFGDGRWVGGGGALELEVAKELRRYALEFEEIEQLAVNAFAEGLEEVAKTLAKSVGMKWYDIIPCLASHHSKDGRWFGVDVMNKRLVDTMDAGILEPLCIKSQAFKIAFETCMQVLRIDKKLTKK